MMVKQTDQKDYITAQIHEGFYFNNKLKLTTIIKEYEKIEKILNTLRYISCITVQVNHLRKVENIYGSITYNDILGRIASMLKAIKNSEFRKEDIFVVDIFDVDSFVIFLSSPRNNDTRLLDHLENISERIWVGIQEELFKLLYPILKENIKVSIGYNLIIKNPMIDNLHLVMQLISDSKKMGEFTLAKRDHIRRYTLQKIIINQEIYSVFQPIVDLRDLSIIGYEALSRGPKGTEYASPQMLFALALECGLSFELDRLCRKKAFESAQHIKTSSKIFVNTLATTIHDPEFRGYYLKELLEDLKIKPENVVFEISEKMAIENYDIFRASLKDYNDIGIIHADDDLGKGYSDLERVMELNPGYLKVDISLVRDIDKSFIKQEIMKAMSNLAENIGSKIIAEGIETKSEYEMLMSLGIKYGQGFLFARPSEDLDSIQKSLQKI